MYKCFGIGELYHKNLCSSPDGPIPKPELAILKDEKEKKEHGYYAMLRFVPLVQWLKKRTTEEDEQEGTKDWIKDWPKKK